MAFDSALPAPVEKAVIGYQTSQPTTPPVTPEKVAKDRQQKRAHPTADS